MQNLLSTVIEGGNLMKRLAMAIILMIAMTVAAAGSQAGQLMKQMRVSHDASGAKCIYDKTTPRGLHNNMCYIYLREQGGKHLSRIVIGAQFEEGSTFEKAEIDATLKRNVPFLPMGYRTDFSKNKMYHVLDVDGEYLQHLIWLILHEDNVGKAKVELSVKRFTGKKIVYTFPITKKQVQAIDRVQKLYLELM